MWRLTFLVLSATLAATARAGPTNIIDTADLLNLTFPTPSPDVELNWRLTNDIDSHIVDGEETKEPVVKASVHLAYPHAVLYGRTCGGSIISPTWILTAGHCTIFSSGRSVLAGTSISDDDSGVSKRVKRIIIHPRFSVGPYWLNANSFGIKQVSARFDFLLVELKEPLPIDNKTIAVIPLDDQLQHSGGEDVSYAGYGAATHGDTMRHTMHKMELETIADETCQNTLVEFDKQDMICTKGRPPRYDSACNGDSGSGLVGDGKLIGVASWVQDDAWTCRPKAIVVFSRVAAVRDWIRQVTGV